MTNSIFQIAFGGMRVKCRIQNMNETVKKTSIQALRSMVNEKGAANCEWHTATAIGDPVIDYPDRVFAEIVFPFSSSD